MAPGYQEISSQILPYTHIQALRGRIKDFMTTRGNNHKTINMKSSSLHSFGGLSRLCGPQKGTPPTPTLLPHPVYTTQEGAPSRGNLLLFLLPEPRKRVITDQGPRRGNSKKKTREGSSPSRTTSLRPSYASSGERSFDTASYKKVRFLPGA